MLKVTNEEGGEEVVWWARLIEERSEEDREAEWAGLIEAAKRLSLALSDGPSVRWAPGISAQQQKFHAKTGTWMHEGVQVNPRLSLESALRRMRTVYPQY